MNLCRLDGTSVAVATRPIPIVFQGQQAVLTALYEITQHKAQRDRTAEGP